MRRVLRQFHRNDQKPHTLRYIAGKNQGTISNCKVTATISGTTTATVSTMNTEVLVGGIAGENRSSSHLDMHGQIKSCEVYGSVFSEALVPETTERGFAYTGGIAGYVSATGKISS